MADASFNLDDHAVDRFIEERGSDFSRRVASMERAEGWALDARNRREPSKKLVEELLDRLRICLERFEAANVTPPSRQMIQVMGSLRSGRALMVLSWCDRVWEGEGVALLNKAIALADQDEACFLMMERILNFERAMVISRVLSKASIRDALEAMDSVREMMETA